MSNQLKSIVLIIFLGLIWITFNKSGLLYLAKLNQEKKRLNEEVYYLQQQENFIEDNIKKLASPNLDYIEFLAYTKYHMIHENEVLYNHNDMISKNNPQVNQE